MTENTNLIHPLLRQRDGHHARVTWEELFFDLVYVFAVTQLSHILLHHLSASGGAPYAHPLVCGLAGLAVHLLGDKLVQPGNTGHPGITVCRDGCCTGDVRRAAGSVW